MRDWTDILNDKINDAELPLPDNDWEWFEAKFRQRRRIAILRWSIYSIAAAVLAIIFLSYPGNKRNNEISPNRTAFTAEKPEVDTSSVRAISAKHYMSVASNQLKPNPVEENKPFDEIHYETPDEPQVIKVTEDTVVGAENASFRYFETQKTKRSRTQLSLAASLKGFSGSSSDNTNEYAWNNQSHNLGLSSDMPIKATHFVPIAYGLNISIPLNNRFSLTSGLDISRYKSLFTLEESIFKGQSSVQKAYYLGFPLRLDMKLWERNSISVWAGAGGKIDRLIYGTIGDNKLKDNTFQLSAIANLGMNYELFDNVCLYFAPQMSLYFRPENSKIITYRTESPLYVSLNLGITINL